ncbi:hypothetical protein PQC38_gp008 [Aeromonas phage BUCT695]|uniref:hypothetical protein n=1 Tax=Aeromonas phage BUCT695 TaxID=2908630 RepID=UPI0023299443|nr:hypothetical protein PQC38_gp008 [Aeromonas phage BUCT695]UIW10484.1 hypothetical protein [Aeromonas phage BUCT695]
MKKLLICLAIGLNGCHPVFADQITDDAKATCQAVGNDSEECIEIVSVDYVKAQMYGADMAHYKEVFDRVIIKHSLDRDVIDTCPEGNKAGCEKVAELTLNWYEKGYNAYQSGAITAHDLNVYYGAEDDSLPN